MRRMATPTIHARTVLRQMDHYILALKTDPVHEAPDALVSLYWLGYTVELGDPASGHVAYVYQAPDPSAGSEPRVRVLTDAPALVTGLGDRLRPGRWPLADPWPEPTPATFERVLLDPYGFVWRVAGADGSRVDARWEEMGEPSFATGPTRDGTSSITTMLIAAGRAMMTLDGAVVAGDPYPDPIWTPWFGSEQTSCVIGLGETLYHPR
jgi:hypothetical protein